ncbi:MAG TPA: hypothetical protein VFS39_01855 [Nitrospira sp.]|nr:hypothetical protein [Nitrospira sp.]
MRRSGVWSRLCLALAMVILFSSSSHGAAKEPQHVIVDIVAINGEEFLVKDQNGAEGTIRVAGDTETYGHVQPGDRIEAWVYPNGDAKTIMILRSAASLREERERQQAESQQRTAAEAASEQPVQR